MVDSIIIGKPDAAEIVRQGFTPVDMHIHTQYSDTHTRVKSILKKATKHQIGVAITDHNQIQGVLKAQELKKDFLVIPGMELGVREFPHLLIYFYSVNDLRDFYERHVRSNFRRWRYGNTNLGATKALEILKGYNCIVAAAHPCSLTRFGLCTALKKGLVPDDIFKGIDAVEVISGTQSRRRNLEAKKLASDLDKAFVGGSDSHLLFEVGRVLTYAKAFDINSFLDAVLKKKNFVVGHRNNPLLMGLLTLKSLDKHIRVMFAPVV